MLLLQKTKILVTCLFLVLVLAQSVGADNSASFQVESVNTQLNDSVYFLNSVLKIELPGYILSAVDQGFELPLALEIEVYQNKRLWFDDLVVFIKQQYVVQYHSLLDSFSILDVNAGQRRYFPSIEEVYTRLSVILNFPVLDNNNLSEDESYHARLRIGVDSSELPIPLKSSSLWKNNWDLKSEWYEWDVTR